MRRLCSRSSRRRSPTPGSTPPRGGQPHRHSCRALASKQGCRVAAATSTATSINTSILSEEPTPPKRFNRRRAPPHRLSMRRLEPEHVARPREAWRLRVRTSSPGDPLLERLAVRAVTLALSPVGACVAFIVSRTLQRASDWRTRPPVDGLGWACAQRLPGNAAQPTGTRPRA